MLKTHNTSFHKCICNICDYEKEKSSAEISRILPGSSDQKKYIFRTFLRTDWTYRNFIFFQLWVSCNNVIKINELDFQISNLDLTIWSDPKEWMNWMLSTGDDKIFLHFWEGVKPSFLMVYPAHMDNMYFLTRFIF